MQSEPPMHLTNCAIDTKLCHARRLCRRYPTFGSSILWSGLISQRRHHLHRRCASSLSITTSLCPIWVRGDACTHMCKTYAHTLAIASLLLSLQIFYLEIGHRPQWQCVLYLPTSFCSKQVVRKCWHSLTTISRRQLDQKIMSLHFLHASLSNKVPKPHFTFYNMQDVFLS